MKILAIDTSCDDTSVAISEDLKIISNVFWSKIKTHEKWGGVVPNEAKRQHEEFLDPAIEEALNQAKLEMKDIELIAVTFGPGLAVALEAGVRKAKELAQNYNIPLVPINHMIGHIYSNLSRDKNNISFSGLNEFKFPLFALTISGGHTDLYIMKDHFKFDHLAYTLDDAIGESFDKVGRLLGLGFPAGSKIEQLALEGDSTKYIFPKPMSNTPELKWSYSGLKTAVLYEVKKLQGEYITKPGKHVYKMEDESSNLSHNQIADLAASFQKAAIEALLIKIRLAFKIYPDVKTLVIGGGVIANTTLRNQLQELCEEVKVDLYYPKPMWLCTDNAAMIATAAYYNFKHGKVPDNFDSIERIPNLGIQA